MADPAELLTAIDLALKGEWDTAHRVVQNLEGEPAAWIHAVLHKIEGDIGNSQYWYRRARRPYNDGDPQAELRQIRTLVAG